MATASSFQLPLAFDLTDLVGYDVQETVITCDSESTNAAETSITCDPTAVERVVTFAETAPEPPNAAQVPMLRKEVEELKVMLATATRVSYTV